MWSLGLTPELSSSCEQPAGYRGSAANTVGITQAPCLRALCAGVALTNSPISGAGSTWASVKKAQNVQQFQREGYR